MNAPDIFSVMTVHALDVAPAEAERVARERWGIDATARLLTGERDRNFHLHARDGSHYVLKFANPVEDAAVTDLQIKALQHLARVDPGLSVPRIVPLPDGAVETPVPHASGAVQRVRLLTWLHGVPLAEARRSAAQRRNLGATLARIQLALADFRHPAGDHPLVWDLRHTLRLREVAFALRDAGARAAVDAVLDQFEAEAAPALPRLRRQVVYNDMNHGNTLMDPEDPDRFAGLIDFGDMVDTAVAIDIAAAMPTMLDADLPHAEALAHFIGGFHATRPLLPEEIALLPTLAAARVAMGLILTALHRHVQPHNPHYKDHTPELIARRLAAIAALRSPETAAALRRACGG
jgi:Ser/Thr protein kinase RdoA (MazF antagonist)